MHTLGSQLSVYPDLEQARNTFSAHQVHSPKISNLIPQQTNMVIMREKVGNCLLRITIVRACILLVTDHLKPTKAISQGETLSYKEPREGLNL